jgi:hypothetical protein
MNMHIFRLVGPFFQVSLTMPDFQNDEKKETKKMYYTVLFNKLVL